MQSVDGDVRLSVTLDTKTVKQSISELKKMFSEAMGYASGTAQSIPNQFDKVTSAVQKTANKISEASKNAQKAISGSSDENIMKAPRISTVPYEELEAKLGVIKERFEKIADEQEALANAGKINTDEFAKLESEANTVGAEIDRLTKLLSEAAEVSSYIEIPIPENANKLRGTIHNVQDAFREAQQSSSDFGTNVSESVGAVSSKYLQLQNNVQKAAEKVELAKLKLQEFQNQSAKPTTEYNALTKELTKVSTEMDKIKQKQDVFNADYGGFAQYMSGYKELEAQMSTVATKYDELNQKRLAMEQAGTAFKSDEVKFQSLSNALHNAERDYNIAVQKTQEFSNTTKAAGGASSAAQNAITALSVAAAVAFPEIAALRPIFAALTGVMGSLGLNSKSAGAAIQSVGTSAQNASTDVGLSFDNIGEIIENTSGIFANKSVSLFDNIADSAKTVFTKVSKVVTNAFDLIAKSSKKAGKSGSGMFDNMNKSIKSGLRNLIRYGIGIEGLFALFNKLRNAAKEGYKNLATYADSVNGSISSMLSMFTQFKNQAAAAFQPLLTTIAPIINSFVNILNQALFSVAQFFAALTGQDYVYKAVKVQTSYVDKLEDTAEAAGNAKKALQGYLSPLDEISKFTADPKDTGILGETKPEDMFETVKVESKFKDLASKIKNIFDGIKDYFSRLFEPIKNAWDKYGALVMEAWKDTLNGIWELVQSIGNAFESVWRGETGQELLKNIFTLFEDIADIINVVSTEFQKAWEDGGRGERYISSILNIFNSILELLHEIAIAFENVWSNGTGEEILGFILDIFTNINDIISGVIDKVKEAWTENGNGERLLQNIFNIVKTVLKFIKDITGATKEWVDNLDLVPIIQAFNLLLEAINPIVDLIGRGLAWVWENILLPFGKWTIEEAAPAALETIAVALRAISAIGERVAPILQIIWEKFLQPAAKFVGDALIKFFNALTKVFDYIATHPEVQSIIVGVLAALAGAKISQSFLGGMLQLSGKDGMIMALVAGLVLLPSMLENVGKGFDNFKKGIGNVVDNVRKWFTEDIPQFFSDCWNSVTGFFEGIPQWFTDTFNSAKEGIENAWAGVGEWFGGVWDNIKLVFSEVGTWFETIFENAWRYIKKAWDGVGNWFSDVWNNIKEAFDGATQWFGDLFNDIWDAIKAPFEAVGSFFDDVWNNIKSAFGGGNPTVGITVGATAGVGGTGAQRGMTLPIPKLAQGAVIPANREFVAMLGDQRNGTNLEAPESLIRKIFREETAATGGGANNYQFTAQINRRTLFDEMITEAKLRRVINNKNPFDLG